MIDAYLTALGMVLDPYILMVMVIAGIYGLAIGCIPGLSATMAIALLVPITFFMPAIPAVAAIVTTSAMAIFAGDIPGCLLRIPGTPASAAYVDEAYQMNLKGHPERALGIGLVFSVIGGLFGSLVMMFGAPMLADFAMSFSSVEFFWLVLLGLGGAVFIGANRPIKALLMLLVGLAIATVGMQNPSGWPRFTFGNTDLLGGFSLIPIMVGMFAVSEVLRSVVKKQAPRLTDAEKCETAEGIDGIFKGMGGLMRRYRWQTVRGSTLGTIIGALPGAGADIAAWMSYAISKRFSKAKEKFGTGHPEGLVEAGASNNSALSGSWIPALVFGIPGDSITAIAIGVLYMKNMNPGPTIFINAPQNIYAIFLIFLVANLLMLPLGWAAIKLSRYVLRIPNNVLMPIILLFSIVGAYAINNSLFDVLVMLGFGVFAYILEDNGYPIAPCILGIVLGPMLENNFIASMIKADGQLIGFVNRPIAAILAGIVFCIVLWTIITSLFDRPKPVAAES